MTGRCCLCRKELYRESAAILTMSGYGNPRCLCADCEALMDAATESNDASNIRTACDELAKLLPGVPVEDEAVLIKMKDVLDKSAEKAKKIDEGTYTPEEEEEDVLEEIPEQLLETEEDRQLDEAEAKRNKLFDRIISWASAAILLAALIFFIIKFIL